MDNLKLSLKKHFGFNEFKNHQESVIKNLLEGNDSFVIMPTGGGKSLCYQLPALIMDGTAIVISPLIALMKNQVDLIRASSTAYSTAHVLNSTLTKLDLIHYTNKGGISWYEFAKYIINLKNQSCIIKKISTEDFGQISKRPHFSELDLNKIQKKYNIYIKNWNESINQYIKNEL